MLECAPLSPSSAKVLHSGMGLVSSFEVGVAARMDARLAEQLWTKLDESITALRKDMTEAKGQLDLLQVMSDVRNLVRGFTELGQYFSESLHQAHVNESKLKTEVASLHEKLRKVREAGVHESPSTSASKLAVNSLSAMPETQGEKHVQRNVDSQAGMKLTDLCELKEPSKIDIQVVKQRTDGCSESALSKNGEEGKGRGSRFAPSGPLTQLLLSVQTNAGNELLAPRKLTITPSSKRARAGREGDVGSPQTRRGQEIQNDRNVTTSTAQTEKSGDTRSTRQQISVTSDAPARRESILQHVEDPAMPDSSVDLVSCCVIGESRRQSGVHGVPVASKGIERVMNGVRKDSHRTREDYSIENLRANNQEGIQTRGSSKRPSCARGPDSGPEDSKRSRLLSDFLQASPRKRVSTDN